MLRKYFSLLGYARQHRTLMFLAGFATLCAALLDALLVNFVKDIINRGFVQKNTKFLTLFPIYILSFFFLRALAGYCSDYLMQKANFSVLRDLRLAFTKRILLLPQSFLDAQSLGRIQSSFSYRIEQIAKTSTHLALCYIREFFLAALLLLIMFIESWQLTLIALVALPVVYFSYKVTAKLLRKTNLRVQEQVGEMLHMSGQVFSNVGTIHSYDVKDFFSNRFTQVLDRNFHSELLSGHYTALLSASLYVVTAIPLALMMVWLFNFSTIPSVGSITALLIALMRIIQPLKIISELTGEFQKALVAQQEVQMYMNQQFNPVVQGVRGKEIKIENLRFALEGDEILRGLSYQFTAGHKVAIVGGSGAGKSSLLQILSGIYPPTSGSIQYPNSSAYVRQDSWIFSASIRENLVFDRSVSDADILDVLYELDLGELVENLPDGLATVIGQGELVLSGGQMQRLCLARALLLDVDWLILDEITSALDRVSEKIVMQRIFSEQRGAIVVTHRLNYLQDFDQVILLEDGHLIAAGKFDELMHDNQVFINFYNRVSKKSSDG